MKFDKILENLKFILHTNFDLNLTIEEEKIAISIFASTFELVVLLYEFSYYNGIL